MKSKKLLFSSILLIAAVLTMTVFSCLVGIVKKPVITKREMPFSITYEVNGQTEVYEGVYEFRCYGADVSLGEQLRFWEGEIKDPNNEESSHYIQVDIEGEGELYIAPCMDEGYVMGDPLFVESHREDEYSPIVYYYDSEGYEYIDEENTGEYGVKIISWEYPEPIENSFIFSHISKLNGDMVVPLVMISLVFLLISIIFVKKESEYEFTALDKISRIFNIIMGCGVLPILTLICALVDVNGDGSSLSCQICYCIPALTVLGIGASICLRRKGYPKSGMFIQFGTIVLFVLVLILDTIFMML